MPEKYRERSRQIRIGLPASPEKVTNVPYYKNEKQQNKEEQARMRKAQKKQAEKFVEILGQAHREIEKALEQKKHMLVLNLLEQCQSGAVELGTWIEEQEGEGFPTVRLLEDYCEWLYQLYERIRLGQAGEGRKEYKALQKFLIQIQNSIQNDISERLETVFLPYKASMWDSLESVWKAADEDPNCDAYVIPIPYYDRNPDGSFGELHYEGNLYPSDVPITRYEDYDFENRQPDMIFIHNPYDKYNYVTSVHPFFYAKNLKQFTEKLVYIPYFVLGEIDPENKEAVESMKHFCTTPGVLYADQVIVQSESMRQIYINVMTEATGENQRGYWEEKILGLGSPKIDKVQKAKGAETEIPEEWERIIRKPDGSRKMVILYNTSVSAMLKHEEKMLRKIKGVFRIFRENQDEVALLWRPHPLMMATIESMRPKLREGYERLVEHYRAEGWGIYDDTVDLDRAIGMSDVYYGDWSSVVQLCQSVGMTVMIQDVEVVNDEDR